MSIFFATCFVAFAIRFEFRLNENAIQLFQQCLFPLLLVKLITFYLFRSFHGWWRYVTFSDLRSLGKATLVSFVLVSIIDHFFLSLQIPRSVLIIDSMLTILALGTVRSSWRLLHEEVRPIVDGTPRKRTVVIGTSDTALRLANQLRSQPRLGFVIVGIASVDRMSGSRWLSSLPVLGDLNALPSLVSAYRVQELLVPAGELTGQQMRELTQSLEASGRKLHVIPRMEDVFSGDGKIPLRDVDINDLLRRDPVVLDNLAIGEIINDRRVLVTGAGGSIGSEISRQVLGAGPAELILLGRGENRIFEIEQELKQRQCEIKIVPVIADITDVPRMRQVFEKFRPEIIFHAAAHKHVPLMEANVGEAIKNNIIGTRGLADLADEYDVRKFVLISTDKAVNPTSVMGTSKHLAERYVNALSKSSDTKFIVVRFGNVLGSNGSVVPTFRRQIENGGPITVTDPRMRRFFMTIPEASRLVLQAAAMGNGGEIFVLDMGEPIKIVDLAKDMIRLSGLPEEAIEIVFSGKRPGEKLYEELYFSDEESLPTSHPKLRASQHRSHGLTEANASVEMLLNECDEEQIKCILEQLVPEYAVANRARFAQEIAIAKNSPMTH
ncbi:polysaccharide biosynthesis protein [Rosistilla ulvae]|uniref:polysaccharide biosynthesis protein n=1 Tax=Rosistilla ulvae TaxID=1930277 RepID=UPI0011A91948|nr:nucleoside-diphosphate sugar epimerase/dehydratase [Rosistilla ulvae]